MNYAITELEEKEQKISIFSCQLLGNGDIVNKILLLSSQKIPEHPKLLKLLVVELKCSGYLPLVKTGR